MSINLNNLKFNLLNLYGDYFFNYPFQKFTGTNFYPLLAWENFLILFLGLKFFTHYNSSRFVQIDKNLSEKQSERAAKNKVKIIKSVYHLSRIIGYVFLIARIILIASPVREIYSLAWLQIKSFFQQGLVNGLPSLNNVKSYLISSLLRISPLSLAIAWMVDLGLKQNLADSQSMVASMFLSIINMMLAIIRGKKILFAPYFVCPRDLNKFSWLVIYEHISSGFKDPNIWRELSIKFAFHLIFDVLGRNSKVMMSRMDLQKWYYLIGVDHSLEPQYLLFFSLKAYNRVNQNNFCLFHSALDNLASTYRMYRFLKFVKNKSPFPIFQELLNLISVWSPAVQQISHVISNNNETQPQINLINNRFWAAIQSFLLSNSFPEGRRRAIINLGNSFPNLQRLIKAKFFQSIFFDLWKPNFPPIWTYYDKVWNFVCLVWVISKIVENITLYLAFFLGGKPIDMKSNQGKDGEKISNLHDFAKKKG
jgi:hypothetical protein